VNAKNIGLKYDLKGRENGCPQTQVLLYFHAKPPRLGPIVVGRFIIYTVREIL